MRYFLISAAFVLCAQTAFAQSVCPDGRAFDGSCVKAGLGLSVQQNVLVFAQPKISYTAPPMLPSDDAAYGVPRDANELRRIYGVDRAPICTTVGIVAPVTTCN